MNLPFKLPLVVQKSLNEMASTRADEAGIKGVVKCNSAALIWNSA